jgi:hypothetical protein
VTFEEAVRYHSSMELDGTILNNLASAVQSARRLRGHPVHPDTLAYWTQLLHHARREMGENSSETLLPLILDLEQEMAERTY